jgi:hypothetical protein
MNRLLSGFLELACMTVIGCNQQTPGGPGITESPNLSKTISVTAERPIYGEADGTFNLYIPSLSTRMKQGQTRDLFISVSRGRNFTEDVTVKMPDLPKGVTVDPGTPVIKDGERQVEVRVQAANDAAVGEFRIVVLGHPERGADATTVLKLVVSEK